jgi:hypothetical protein
MRFAGFVAALLVAPWAGAQVFDVELVQNGGAENGPASPDGIEPVPNIPGWSFFVGMNVVRYGQGPEFPTSVSPGPPSRGQQFFAGGNNSGISTASQNIDVSAGAARIDSGLATFRLRAWLGGSGTQDDSALLTAIFNDAFGNSLATATLSGPFAVERGFTTGLMLREHTGSVPVGTRSVQVVITMLRVSGTYNNGYADEVSLRLSAPPICDADVNCDGSSDGFDVEAMEQAVGGDISNFCQADPDFNGDGSVDGFDVETVEQVVGGAPCP